jgi:hypothetical protein
MSAAAGTIAGRVAEVMSTEGAATSKARVTVFSGPPPDASFTRKTYRPGGRRPTGITCVKIARAFPAVRGATSCVISAAPSSSGAISYVAVNAPAPLPYASMYPCTEPNTTR